MIPYQYNAGRRPDWLARGQGKLALLMLRCQFQQVSLLPFRTFTCADQKSRLATRGETNRRHTACSYLETGSPSCDSYVKARIFTPNSVSTSAEEQGYDTTNRRHWRGNHHGCP